MLTVVATTETLTAGNGQQYVILRKTYSLFGVELYSTVERVFP